MTTHKYEKITISRRGNNASVEGRREREERKQVCYSRNFNMYKNDCVFWIIQKNSIKEFAFMNLKDCPALNNIKFEKYIVKFMPNFLVLKWNCIIKYHTYNKIISKEIYIVRDIYHSEFTVALARAVCIFDRSAFLLFVHRSLHYSAKK